MAREHQDSAHINGTRYTRSNHSHSHGAKSRDRLILWRMRGAADELTCVVGTTAYGYTLGLELAGQPILLELQASLNPLVDKASRLEAWLLTQGWLSADQLID
jgi:hypothetical protein